MSDQNTAELSNEDTKQEYTVEQLLQEKQELETKLKAVVSHQEKLLGETKKAKEDRANSLAEAKRIADDKAKSNGEFEELYKSKDQEANEYKKQLEDYKRSVRNDKLQASALRIATDLADGDNAELLSEFVIRKLDGLADETGVISDNIVTDLKKEFANNQKYKSLLRSSKASGGNALGNVGNKAETKEISRADFDKMDQLSRKNFFAGKGRVVD